ncbi:hypothetical protein CR513_26227, partial [Mucuna pruriens]
MGAKRGGDMSPLRAATKIMIKKGYRVGKGLGKHLDGITRPVQVSGNLGKLGLSYQLQGRTLRKMPIGSRKRIGHLQKYFVNNGFANQVEEEADQLEERGLEDYVNPCLDLTAAVNWVVFDLPKKEVKVGTVMHPEDRINLVQLVEEYVDIFAWSY